MKNLFRKADKRYEGFSLLEIVISLGIFILVISTLSLSSLEALRGIRNNQNKTDAHLLMDSLTRMVLEKKFEYWTDFVLSTDSGPKSMAINSGLIELVDGVTVDGELTHWLDIETVNRENNNIVQTGGVLDPYSRRITITVSWDDPLGIENQLVKELYINDWNTARWTVTTLPQFQPGTFTSTTPVDLGDGGVGLTTLLYPDWCNPALTMTSYDIRGQGDARTVFATVGNAYFGTGGNASGVGFTHSSIDGVENPTVTIQGQFDGAKVNDIYVDTSGNYAYLATDTNDAEVIIISLLQKPYVQIGSVDGSGSTNASAVAQSGDYGFVAQGSRITVFNLTAKSGIRANISSLNLNTGGTITDIDIAGNYAFVSINSGNRQVVAVDITNPAVLVQKAGITVNSYGANSVFVKEDTNRVYIGTASNSGNEFFIVDSTNKNGPWSILSAYDTLGMTITGVALVDDYSFAILVGNSGVEYQVVRITNETSPAKCGQIDFPYSVHDIATVKDGEGNVFSYAVTADSAQEFRIIRGGAGGGWGNGYGFSKEGSYTSTIYDTGSINTVYYYISWLEQVPAYTDLRVQIRTSNSPTMVGATWVGPDGTSATYFTENYGHVLPTSLNFNRYIQFRGYFSGDSIVSPLLEEISISYQN